MMKLLYEGLTIVSLFLIGTEHVYVSKALQKAKIIVNEDGTKASAATSEYFSFLSVF